MIRTDTEHIFNLQDYEHKTNNHVIYTMLMKKILCFVLLILGIGITFSSCSKQGAGNSSHSDLIGKWKCIEEGNEIDGEYVVETTSSSLVYVFDKTTITANNSINVKPFLFFILMFHPSFFIISIIS